MKIEWIRAEYVPCLKDKPIFSDDLSANDIKPSSAASNHNFLSAIAALAQKPSRIKSLFHSTDINDQGLFCVNLTKNGEPVQVIIDSFIPCFNGAPAFSSSAKNDLWLLILEKAWAKLHGSYERIRNGSVQEILRDLTGAPVFDYSTADRNLWLHIQKQVGHHDTMLLASGHLE